jgi:VanZ family protein
MRPSRYGGSLAVWLLLLAYASLYPLFPMRLPPAEALQEALSLPRYLMRSDVVFNVLAYIPFGTLATLFFRQRGDVRRTIPKAIALAAVFSLSMETVQLFIPNRVASFTDLVCNVGGAVVGALMFADPVYSMATARLGDIRERLVIDGAWGDAGLVLLGLWILAQFNPALPFFGAGNIGEHVAPQLLLVQWVAAGMGICGFGLFVSSLLRGEGALRVTVVLLSVALWLKFAASTFMLQPNFSAEWVNIGRMAGIAGGVAAMAVMRRLGRLARIYLALLLILAGAMLSKIFGAYSAMDELLRLFRWPHGQLASFATLTRFIHELWPVAAVVFLVALFFHVRREPPAARMAAP